MMKKFFSFVILSIFVTALFLGASGCGKKGPPQPPDEARNLFGISR